MAIIVKSPSWDHYPRVATIQESVKWQLLSKALLGSTIQGWPLSKSQLSDNYCQKPFLGALSKGQLGVFKLISIRGTLSKHSHRYLPGRGVGGARGWLPPRLQNHRDIDVCAFFVLPNIRKSHTSDAPSSWWWIRSLPAVYA